MLVIKHAVAQGVAVKDFVFILYCISTLRVRYLLFIYNCKYSVLQSNTNQPIPSYEMYLSLKSVFICFICSFSFCFG